MKTIVVTDIHGCLEELESVWAQAGFDPETDKLICLGDLMDRGPYSFGVFDRFRSLKRKMGERCIMILGNHDDMMMNSFYDQVFYTQLGVKLCSMAGGGVQKIYMVFLREPSRRDRSGSDLFHLRDGFEIKMNFDRNVSCFIFVNALMHDDFFD